MTIIQKIDYLVAHFKEVDRQFGIKTTIYCFEIDELEFSRVSVEIIGYTRGMELAGRNTALTGNSERFVNSGLIEVNRGGIRFNICKQHP